MHEKNFIAIFDFGSQTTKLIARRIREAGVYSKVFQADTLASDLAHEMPAAIIFSGGPESLESETKIKVDEKIFDLKLPILGICYGMQLLVDHFKGQVKRSESFEFGLKNITLKNNSLLFKDMPNELNVWMSHFDQVADLAHCFETVATSQTCAHVAIENHEKNIFGVQFHPEVSHTQMGQKIIENFIFNIAKVKPSFDLKDFLSQKVLDIKEQVGDGQVLMGLSGGVDSSVAAVLIHQAIKDQLHCVYVNHGLHRQGEIEEVKELFGHVLKMDLRVVDAQEQFFAALKGVTEPEQKRKIIGKVFIDVFEKEAQQIENISFLGQGTLYPDVIESECQNKGPSHVIKSHHNVGGLPEKMNLKLVEPLRELFKDEVRRLGKFLGLADKVLERQPFPGPGMAVRVIGEVTQERVKILQKADAIVRDEIDQAISDGRITQKLWQWFAILLPVKSVGVMGDARVYGDTVVIRCVESEDAMTADWSKLPYELLEKISCRVGNEVVGVSRCLYDITQKPPGTIEWE